ncbi:hypothetical protein JFK98_02760 [Enterococcus faecium]|nr:hypothetical protein [Enterococcus faecium]
MMQTWLERLIRFQQNYHKLMQGRYAKFDQLNRCLLIAALVFSLLSRWLPYRIGQLLFIVFFGWMIFRFLSKKIYPRLNENQRYLKYLDRVKEKYHQIKNKKQVKMDRKSYTFFECPNCHQKQRAPKGKGRIRVTCKTCGIKFETNV